MRISCRCVEFSFSRLYLSSAVGLKYFARRIPLARLFRFFSKNRPIAPNFRIDIRESFFETCTVMCVGSLLFFWPWGFHDFRKKLKKRKVYRVVFLPSAMLSVINRRKIHHPSCSLSRVSFNDIARCATTLTREAESNMLRTDFNSERRVRCFRFFS